MTNTRTAYMQQRPGAILLIILGIVFIASILVALIIEHNILQLRASGAHYKKNELRLAAYSAFEATLAHLEELKLIDQQLYSPAQGWIPNFEDEEEKPWASAIKVNITVEDEGSRIPLNSNQLELLRQLFLELDYNLITSQTLAESLMDWTDSDDNKRRNGAEKDEYKRFKPEYKPPNRALNSFDELRYIKGFKRHMFEKSGKAKPEWEKLKSLSSLYNNNNVNLNTADEAVLKVLNRNARSDLLRMGRTIAGRDGVTGNEDDLFLRELPPTRTNGLSVQAEVLKIEVRAQRGPVYFLLSAIVQNGGSANHNTGNNQESGNGSNPAASGSLKVLKLSENESL